MARSASAETRGLFPELRVDRLCHRPVGRGGPGKMPRLMVVSASVIVQ
jgi:hypothetical protein